MSFLSSFLVWCHFFPLVPTASMPFPLQCWMPSTPVFAAPEMQCQWKVAHSTMGAKNDINNLHINVSAFDKWDSLCVLCSVRPGRRRFCGVVQRNETFADWNLMFCQYYRPFWELKACSYGIRKSDLWRLRRQKVSVLLCTIIELQISQQCSTN